MAECSERMTRRDRFALAALQGLTANPNWLERVAQHPAEAVASAAFEIADAMEVVRRRK